MRVHNSEVSDEFNVFLSTNQNRKSLWPRDQTSISIYSASYWKYKICSSIEEYLKSSRPIRRLSRPKVGSRRLVWQSLLYPSILAFLSVSGECTLKHAIFDHSLQLIQVHPRLANRIHSGRESKIRNDSEYTPSSGSRGIQISSVAVAKEWEQRFFNEIEKSVSKLNFNGIL
jgi:hypothetical protein